MREIGGGDELLVALLADGEPVAVVVHAGVAPDAVGVLLEQDPHPGR
jgi:hypothetical protein